MQRARECTSGLVRVFVIYRYLVCNVLLRKKKINSRTKRYTAL